jgi:hypothetical protein
MNGGGFTVSGGSASVIGSGVTVYNTFDASHSYKPVTISGGGAVNLSAPTSGAMEGLLFFQDRNVVTSSQDAITGGSATKLEGVLYFPKTQLVYSGGSSGSAKYTTVIAKDLSVTGNSTFNDDYSSLSGGSPIKTVAMVE